MISKVFMHSFLKPMREVYVATVNDKVNKEIEHQCDEDDEEEIDNSENINKILSHVWLFNGSLEEKKTTASID